MSDNIIVAIRVRPFISRERNSSLCWTVEQSNQITQLNGDGKHLTAHVFDRVYDQVSSTEEVYNDTAAPIVEAAMHGFHGTLFAYGQTSSGKTHTMTGDKDCPGIVQLAVEDIFNTIENSPEREFLIRVSYLEIYQENVVDLLGNLAKHLDIKENYHGTVFVENLKENVATSVEEVMTEMKKAEVNRHIGATKMNERSSRSHTIFRVIIESHLRTEESVKSDDVDDAVMVAHLNFVDLAGSENAKQAGASGQRLAESGAINKSLFSLSLVIGQLSTGSTFVNYRNSRLTRILQNALGGNSKTAIICTISPASLDQSISTLRFATSAKSIKNKPVVNEVISGETMLKRYKKEIHELKKQLEEAKCASSHVRSDIGMSQSKEDKIELLTRLFCVSSQLGGATGTRRNARSEARRRETWCPGRGGVPLPPFLAARGATYPQPLLPPSMLPQNKDEPSSPEEPIKVASESTATHNSSPVKTAEKNVARNNNEAEKELTVARQRIVELESREAELVAAHDKELSRLQAQLESGKTEAENVHKSHLDEIACITQSRDEAAEQAKAVKMQIIEVQTFGRDLISNYQQEIADLEARLESTKLEVEHMCKSHLEEIACLTQSRDEAAEQAKTAKMQIIEVQTFGKDLISKYQQEVADLEAELESAKLEAEHNCELHLEDITRLTKDCHEANEELEVARTQISEMQTMGREMIAKHHHQVALLEADLEAAREKQPCVSCERHLEEISRLTQSRDDAVEDLETARSEMAKMKAMGTEMIRNLQQQVAELEADLISTRETQESASSELHLANIARLKQDCHEADEELEAARTQISEMQTMGREMIAKHQHQVAILEAELKSTKKGSENHITRETYEKERQRLMRCCDDADDELEAAKRSQATWNREKEGLLAEVDQLKQTIARIQIKNTMLENELVQVQDPHIRRIKFFEQELNRVVTINKTLKNEIRDLHNKQSNESFLQPRQMKVSQKTNEYAEGEKEFRLQVEVKRLSKKVEALQAALDAQGKNT